MITILVIVVFGTFGVYQYLEARRLTRIRLTQEAIDAFLEEEWAREYQEKEALTRHLVQGVEGELERLEARG